MDATRAPRLRLFYLLFFLSGAAGLIYQAVWLRMFTLVLGNSLYSASIVFASFMGGLALGAWLLGALGKRTRDPLMLYVVLELGIALTGLTAGWLIPHLSAIIPFFQRWMAGSAVLTGLFRSAGALLVLLPPTMMLGGTLPVLTRYLATGLDTSGRRLGALYGWNTAGAVAGCVITGFWLLRLAGMNFSLYTAAAVNLAVAGAAFVVRLREGSPSATPAERDEPPARRAGGRRGGRLRLLLLIVAGLSGMVALACEVTWGRFLSYILHNDIYAFYLMLSTILAGLGAGSLVYSRWLDRSPNRLLLLGMLQTALGLCLAGFYLLTATVYLSGESYIWHSRIQNFVSRFARGDFLPLLTVRLLYTMCAMLVPSLILGASFPLICRLYFTDPENIGWQTGLVYAVNTVGAVAGSLLAGFLLVPALGVQATLFSAAGVSLLLGLLVILYEARLRERSPGLSAKILLPACAAAFLAMTLLPSNQVRGLTMKSKGHTDLIFYEEGLTGTVSVVEDRINEIHTLSINTIGEVHNSFTGMQTFKVLGHLPLLLHEGVAGDVLMVTFGAGIASGAVAVHPVKRLDVVELEPGMVRAGELFREENLGVADDPRVHIHLEDGRYFLAGSDRDYDVIISDATNPASADSWVLYTLEFYRMCRERLAAGGVMAQWLPVHTGSPDTYATILRTFQEVFPHTTVWYIKDYTVLVGLPGRFSLDYPSFARELAEPALRDDLAPFCLDRPLELLDCFLMGEEASRRMASGSRLSTDDRPVYQLEVTELAEPGRILDLLIEHRESLGPYITGIRDSLSAAALTDSLRAYYFAEGRMLARDYPGAARYAPFSCKYAKYLEEYNEEVAYLLALARLEPGNYRTLTRVGLALTNHGEYEQAREMFRNLREMNPSEASIHSTLGNIAFKLGDYSASIRSYRRALELGHETGDILINLGLALFGWGHGEQGIEYLERAVSLDSTNAGAYYYLALGYNRLGQREKEVSCYERVLRLDSDHTEALVNLGYIYLERGNYMGAEQLFTRACSLDPHHELAWDGLGRVMLLQGEYAAARRALNRQLELRPGDQATRRLLSRIDSLTARP